MDDADEFDVAYQATTRQAADVGGAASADAYAADVRSAMDDGVRALNDIAAGHGKLPIDFLKGFMAEGWHATTFNIDAARQRLQHQVQARVLEMTSLGSPDIRVDGPEGPLDYQLKYWKTPADSGAQLSDPSFAPMGKVAPADQIAALKDAVTARADRVAERAPEVAEHLRDTARRVTDRIAAGDVGSRPLDHAHAKDLARAAREGSLDAQGAHLTLAETLKASDLARESAIGAATAAIVSATFAAAPHVARGVLAWLADRPEHEQRAHIERAFREGGKGLAVGGLRGGVAAGLVLAAQTGALGEAARSLSPGAIGALTALVLQGATDAWAFRTGTITSEELATRLSRNAAVASVGAAGASVGQVLIPIPVLGAVIGSVVGSALATVAHAGGREALRRLENREGWEAQVGLARAVSRLASELEIAVEGTVVLVRQSQAELALFQSAARSWQESAEHAGAHLARAARASDETRRRLDAGALGRLSSRPAKPEDTDG